MGSLFSPKTVAPPPPPPPTLIRDEINKVEQVPVNNPDGTVTYVTRAIPLTEEEQANQDELKRIMQESLAEIERLSDSDYADDVETKKILDAWEAERQDTLDDNFVERRRAEEKALARRGLGDSSAGQSVRRRRQLDQQESNEQLDRERTLLGQDIRNQRIGLQQGLYSIASSETNADAARKQQAAVRGQSALVSSNNARQASLLNYYRLQQQNSGGGLFNVFANAALTGLGGAIGAPIGKSIGSHLGLAIGSGA